MTVACEQFQQCIKRPACLEKLAAFFAMFAYANHGPTKLDWTCLGKILCRSHQLSQSTPWSIGKFTVGWPAYSRTHLKVIIPLPGRTFRSRSAHLGVRLGNHRGVPQGLSSACSYLLQQPCSCPPWQAWKGVVGGGLHVFHRSFRFTVSVLGFIAARGHKPLLLSIWLMFYF